MAYQETRRYTRFVGNKNRPPFPLMFKAGDDIKVEMLQKDGEFRKDGYLAVVLKSEWRPMRGTGIWQEMVTAQHPPDTKGPDGKRVKGRTIIATYPAGMTRIKLKVEEKTDGVLEMYGPECPAFLVNDQVRTSYKHQPFTDSPHQSWIPGIVKAVRDTRASHELPAQYEYDIDDYVQGTVMPNLGVTEGWYFIESADSKRHRA